MLSEEKIKEIFKPFLEVTQDQISDIKLLTTELQSYNKKVNLTSLESDEEILIGHFLDSFTLLPYIKNTRGDLIDIGTGGGFPGLPIKIILKKLKVTLLNASKKKTEFIRHIKGIMEFDDLDIVWGRAEEFGQKEDMREKFDYVTSRAVAEMNILLELCMPFVKPGGYLLAQKGKDIAEIKDSENVMSMLGGKLEEIKMIRLPNDNFERSLAVIRKTGNTPKEYPRRNGVPQKKPLK